MTRRLKTLGLALVAVFAMSAVVASAASATNDAFTAASAPVTLTGKQEGKNKFILAGQAVECNKAEVTAHVDKTTTVEVTTTEPVYKECSYAGQAATVDMTGCDYKLTGTTDELGHAKAHVECPEGKHIDLTLNAIKCSVTVHEQEATEGYKITTVSAGGTTELTLDITAKVTVTSDPDPTEGITCASLTNGSGTLEGQFSVTGETPDGKEHISISDESTPEA